MRLPALRVRLFTEALHRLEALEAFIESQKALLARTQSDVERLRALRAAAAEYEDPLEDLAEEVYPASLPTKHLLAERLCSLQILHSASKAKQESSPRFSDKSIGRCSRAMVGFSISAHIICANISAE